MLSPYFLIDKGSICLKKYMYFYINNKKRGSNFFDMKVFFYFHRFIFKNTSGILKKKHISIRFFKETNSLEIKITFCPWAHDTIEPALKILTTIEYHTT